MPQRKWLLATSLALFLVFIYFSYLVHKGTFNQFDFDTTVKFQNRLSHKFDFPFSLISLVGSAEITTLIWLIITAIALVKKFWKTVLLLMLFPISQLVEIYGKTFVYHPAPPFLFYRGALPFNFPSSYVHTNFSYPSGHATRLTFLVVFIILFLGQKFSGPKKVLLNGGLLTFLLLVYISRIYLAEHWTTDVVGGALLGGSLGIVAGLTLVNKHS